MLRRSGQLGTVTAFAVAAGAVAWLNWTSAETSVGRVFLVVWAATAVLLAPSSRVATVAATLGLGMTAGLAVALRMDSAELGGLALTLVIPIVLGWAGRLWETYRESTVQEATREAEPVSGGRIH